MTDAVLVARLQRKDHAAYDALVAQYGDALYGYLFLSTHNHQQNEALLGAAFLRVVAQIDRYDSAGPRFIVWLYRIAHTATRDIGTATPRNGRVAARTVAESSIPPPATHALAFESARVHKAFATLPLEEQQVITLRCVANLSLYEVGYVLGKSNSATKQLQFQALRALGGLLL